MKGENNMKKRLAVLLAMGMAMTMTTSVFAAAASPITQASDTKKGTVDLTYEVTEAYTVTIPDAVTFTNTEAKTGTVKADGVLIANGKNLVVKVSSTNYSDGWTLKDQAAEANTLKYTIKKGTTSATDVSNDGEVLKVEAGTATGEETLNFQLTAAGTKAGTYKDTLTFTVSVADAAVQQ